MQVRTAVSGSYPVEHATATTEALFEYEYPTQLCNAPGVSYIKPICRTVLMLCIGAFSIGPVDLGISWISSHK